MSNYIKTHCGNFSLLILVPHGGEKEVQKITCRNHGSQEKDLRTIDLSLFLERELKKIGIKPYLIINEISRNFLDVNRPKKEAYEELRAKEYWEEYHRKIQETINDCRRKYGRCFIIDVHGQSHTEEKIELGYGINKAELRKNDITHSTLHIKDSDKAKSLIKGYESLGYMLERAGYRATPSRNKTPRKNEAYFCGGYTIRKYCKQRNVMGLQIEFSRNIRKNKNSIKQFTCTFAPLLKDYLKLLGFENEERINIMGYGSLISHKSLRETIHDRPFLPVYVKGYKRIFNLAVKGGDDPNLLNAIREPNHLLNGVLFSVNKGEYEKLMKREIHYRAERVNVYDFKNHKKIGNAIIVSDHHQNIDDKGLLPNKDYFKLCHEAAFHISKEFGEFWEKTTFTSENRPIPEYIKTN